MNEQDVVARPVLVAVPRPDAPPPQDLPFAGPPVATWRGNQTRGAVRLAVLNIVESVTPDVTAEGVVVVIETTLGQLRLGPFADLDPEAVFQCLARPLWMPDTLRAV
jgi:hypothetical protein